jgi:uncharacterized OsmC-like protein
MDYLLVGMGACTAIDVVDIMRKMREPLGHIVGGIHPVLRLSSTIAYV